jgi:hypothetical protein
MGFSRALILRARARRRHGAGRSSASAGNTAEVSKMAGSDRPFVSIAENTAQKQQIGRPFEPGQSGNPARNKATLAVEILLDGEAEEITRKQFAFASIGLRPREKTGLCSSRCPPWARQKTRP